MKKIIILLLAILLLTGCGTTRLDNAGEIMKKVQTKYEKASSIQVEFSNSNYLKSSVISFKGSTIYKAPDKFITQTIINNTAATSKQSQLQGTLTYVSDGKILWQVSQQNKQKPHVFQKNLTESQAKEDVYSIVFKDTKVKNKNYSLLRTEKQKNIFYYVLQLKEQNKITLLWIDGDQWEIDKTEVYQNGSQLKSTDLIARTIYSNYIFNKNVSDDKFNFTPPKGAILDQDKS